MVGAGGASAVRSPKARSPPNPTQAKKMMNPMTSQVERRRLASCWCEEVAASSLTARAGLLNERSTVGTARSPRLDLPQLSGLALASPATSMVGNVRLLGVVLCRDVVVELPREPDLVLRAGQLLLELQHVLVGLEVGIGSRSGRTAGRAPGSARPRPWPSAPRPWRSPPCSGPRLPPRACPLELHRALHRVDQVGNQVVPALELHVDLLPGVGDLVLERR